MRVISAIRRRPALWAAAALLALLAAAWVILTMPLTTRQGVNARVTEYRIPAYVKALDFLQRHYQYRLHVSRICAGATSDVQCVLAIFDWTHTNIPRTPQGWTVVDDHITNIIIRGHGESDQIADVFVTLTGYAGVPSVFRWLNDGSAGLVLAFARLDDRWVMFDVERHIVFRNRRGDLADVHELVNDPSLVDDQTGHTLIRGRRYSSFITAKSLLPFEVAEPTRAEMQQPWARLRYELRRAVGMGTGAPVPGGRNR
jgi:hypothetical protein